LIFNGARTANYFQFPDSGTAPGFVIDGIAIGGSPEKFMLERQREIVQRVYRNAAAGTDDVRKISAFGRNDNWFLFATFVSLRETFRSSVAALPRYALRGVNFRLYVVAALLHQGSLIICYTSARLETHRRLFFAATMHRSRRVKTASPHGLRRARSKVQKHLEAI
jgi:hypothetical protein